MESVKLREIALVVNGFGFPEIFQGTRDLSVLFTKVSDMNAAGSERFVCNAANTVNATMLRQIGAKTYPSGTIIFPKVGGALLTNKKRVLGVEATFDNNIMGVVPENADSEWLYYWLQTVDLRTLANTQALPSIRQSDVGSLTLNLPPPPEQRRIAARLREQLAEVANAQSATGTQSESLGLLTHALLRESLSNGRTQTLRIADCL
jgi:type I restriction enzyme, S subunit